jgi:hypothetical protein
MERKFCVFCGKQPIEKTKEHVLSNWLLEYTGNPKRIMKFHYFDRGNVIEKTMSFSDFTFPACNKCNNAFSKLEKSSKSAVNKLENNLGLNCYEMDKLFDWFDKVRIGLWLGIHFYFAGNNWGIIPNFYINQRVGTSDRALIIYRIESRNEHRLMFPGTNTPSFAHSPTCFALYINEIVLINISTDFLVSTRSGYPYPHKILWMSNGGIGVMPPIYFGKKKIESPILGMDFDKRCTVITQTIVKKYLYRLSEYYKGNDYMKQNKLSRGKMKPIMQIENHKPIILSEKEQQILCENKLDIQELLFLISKQVLIMQNELLQKTYIEGKKQNLNYEKMHSVKYNCIKFNNVLIKDLREK